MSASNKLSTAVKALCYLANSFPEPRSSVEIAESINTNASKLRMILSLLVKSNIVESWHGTSGGFILRKAPENLHLQEIYCAIEDRKAFHLDVNGNNSEHNSETAKLNEYFLDLFADIQVDIEEKMKKITIQSVMESVKKKKNTLII